eukprot:2915661-Pyramimonas_sp.AAC.1
MKDSRTKRSPPEPCLPSPRHHFTAQVAPFRASGFPMPFRIPHTFRESSGVCEGTTRSWLCFGLGTSGSL